MTGRHAGLFIPERKHIITLNVKGLLGVGILHILEHELLRQAMVISETHSKDRSHIKAAEYISFISGDDNIRHTLCVATLVHKKM